MRDLFLFWGNEKREHASLSLQKSFTCNIRGFSVLIVRNGKRSCNFQQDEQQMLYFTKDMNKWTNWQVEQLTFYRNIRRED